MTDVVLFKAPARSGGGVVQVPSEPLAKYTTTFTPAEDALMRVYADAGNGTITINGISWVIPLGTVEWYACKAGQQVTVV